MKSFVMAEGYFELKNLNGQEGLGMVMRVY